MDAPDRHTTSMTRLWLVAVLAAAFAAPPAPAQEQAARGGVVVVHGAWADASGWSDVVARLEQAGYDVTTPQFPLLASLEENVELLSEVLAVQEGPVLLVAHAHGGILVSMLPPGEGRVAGSAFVAGLVPDEGESLEAVLARERGLPAAEDLDFGQGGFAWLPRSDFSPDPESDLDPDEAYRAHAARQPLFAGATGEVVDTPIWRTLPTWYLVAAEDEVVPADEQRRFAERMGATVTDVAAGHLVMVTHPDEVAEFIAAAAADAFEP